MTFFIFRHDVKSLLLLGDLQPQIERLEKIVVARLGSGEVREEFEKCFPKDFVNKVRRVFGLEELSEVEENAKESKSDNPKLNLNNKKKYSLPKILGFGIAAVIIVAIILFLIIYFVRSGSVQEIKNKQKTEEKKSENGVNPGENEPSKNKENKTGQTQNSHITKPDSQKSSRTGLIVGGTAAGALGVAGVGTSYGFSRSRSNSVEKNKKDDKSDGKNLVYVDPVGNKESKIEGQKVTNGDANNSV